MTGILGSRWGLRLQAIVIRFLMQIGMFLGRLPAPRPPRHSFERIIPSTISPNRGEIPIKFYLPKDYRVRKELDGKRFPLLINHHGGGFSIGTAGDDARWSAAVNEQVGAIVADVDYRLAPEYIFPTAVEDGVDAVMWITSHADELHVDVDRIAVSGFSAGGNLVFAVPMMLRDKLQQAQKDVPYTDDPSRSSSKSGSSVLVAGQRELLVPKIAAIVAFYPAVDYTLSREQRISSFSRQEYAMPAFLRHLFDESYLQPRSLDRSSPYLSPGVAPDDMVQALPDDIIMYTCEWDMLQAEGERFKDRLESLGKRVSFKCIPSVPHGWDKHPNPFSVAPSITETYCAACKELKKIFGSSVD